MAPDLNDVITRPYARPGPTEIHAGIEECVILAAPRKQARSSGAAAGKNHSATCRILADRDETSLDIDTLQDGELIQFSDTPELLWQSMPPLPIGVKTKALRGSRPNAIECIDLPLRHCFRVGDFKEAFLPFGKESEPFVKADIYHQSRKAPVSCSQGRCRHCRVLTDFHQSPGAGNGRLRARAVTPNGKDS